MPSVVEDLIEGHSLSLGKDGFQVQRVFHVSDVAGNAPARLYTAINTTGVPQRGDFHPDIPGIRAENVSAVPLDTSNVKVTVTYTSFRVEVQPPEAGTPPSIHVGSTVQESQANTDATGADIVVTHTYTDRQDANGNNFVDPQPGFVSIQVPLTVVRITRKEAQAPYYKSIEFVGTVNSTTFLRDPARYWLCSRIEGSSDDGGVSYTVSYEFQRNPDTWDARVVYVVPETYESTDGKVIYADKPHPVQGDQDVKKFIMYPQTDFSALSLGV